jgi:hypothetical protein
MHVRVTPHDRMKELLNRETDDPHEKEKLYAVADAFDGLQEAKGPEAIRAAKAVLIAAISQADAQLRPIAGDMANAAMSLGKPGLKR